MRFLLGVLVGYTLRDKHKLLIGILVTLMLVVYVILPAIALLALRLDVTSPEEVGGHRALASIIRRAGSAHFVEPRELVDFGPWLERSRLGRGWN